ncbi:hypothetical protein D3C81_1887460 [compost metagenome]
MNRLICTAYIFPVRNFASENVNQLLLSQAVYACIRIRYSCDSNNRYLMVNQCFCFFCIGIFQLFFCKYIGVTDIHLFLSNLCQSGAASSALNLNVNAVISVHEAFCYLLNKRLQCCRTRSQNRSA